MSFMDRDVYGQLSFGALRILLRFVLAVVSLEVLLRNAVECERGNRAFEERSCHAPWAARAAPAAEVVAIDWIRRLSINKPLICVEVRTRVCDSRAPRTQLSRATDYAHNLRLFYVRQVPKVLRPCLSRTVISETACDRASTDPRYGS